jgi:ATP-binding cassette subfamily B protein
VDRENERAAFAKAFAYLNYHPTAKWSAFAAAVGTGILYVALLGVLWLFADLIVHQGRIPAYGDLSIRQKDRLSQAWLESKGNALEVWGLKSARFTGLGTQDPLQMTPREQDLVWRAHLYTNLRDRIGVDAALAVLPAFRDLPDAEKTFVEAWWLKSHPELAVWPIGIPVPPLIGLPVDEERMWRQFLRDQLSQGGTEDQAVASLLEQELQAVSADGEPAPLEERTLDDHGILSLVVRSTADERLYSRPLAWVASWNAWMWNVHPWGWSNFVFYLLGLFVIALALALLRALLSYVLNEMAAQAVIEASTRLRRAVYHHTFRLGTLAFKELGPSEAVSIFVRHVESVHEALFVWLTSAVSEPIKFVLLLAFALFVNFWLALAFLLFAILVWYAGGQVAAHYRRQGRIATNHASEQLALIRETLMMMRLVKVYLMELFNQSRVERLLARYGKAQMIRFRGEAIYRPLFVFLGTLAALVLLAVAGVVILSGQLGVASAITLAAALVSLYWPTEKWLSSRKILRRGRESSVVLFHFLDRPGEVGQVVGAEFLPPLSKQIEFDNVSLRDAGSGRFLLHKLSLTIKAGQRVGLVGADELEKHALVYLVPRLLDPTSGEIRIDQYNLRWVTLDSLRAQIGIVLQHNLVFHDTVANNIGCGDPAYGIAQIIEAAKIAHAHNFIQKLPKGYETPIGEMGHSLNVTEKFRIGLARAILRDPALLIIEEPDLAMDDDVKALLDDTFARVLPGRTALFLPHRISTIRSCDQIYLLSKGGVEATGVHRELLTQNPLYRHLHYLEFNEIAEQV